MDIELLGSPRLREGDEPVQVAVRQRALLAALALHAPRAVSVDRLVEVVWAGEDLPADPVNALQQRVSSLRRLLDPGRRGDVLVVVDGGYALQVGDAQIDVRRFEALATEGRRLLQAGEHTASEQTLLEALELWRGPALDGCAEQPWAAGEISRLEELRSAAIDDRAEALLAAGRHDEVAVVLSNCIVASPMRERTCGLLMTALFRSGRQADALARYEVLRERLADELGVDPGPDLQRLHVRILQQDPVLMSGVRPDVTGVTVASVPAGRLATPLVEVIGRDSDAVLVGRLLAGSRLVTLTGPGGAGKSTLALAAARQQHPRDGVVVVELAPVTQPSAVAGAFARALGLAGGMGRAAEPDTVLAALAGRELLLVVDNCEHLIDEVASLVQRILGVAAAVRVLATSRVSLGVTGEVLWSVPPLTVPHTNTLDAVERSAAVRLLVSRARAHTPKFALDEGNAPILAEVVRRLDGLPLAIELAAARLRILAPSELLEGLTDRFRTLAGGARTAPSRQRTLRGALDWSWDLLDEPEQRGLAALSVPLAGASMSEATALLEAAGVDADPAEILAALVDHSLLIAEHSKRPTRYRMLASVREYGLHRLDELDLTGAVGDRHTALVEQAVESCHADGDFPDLAGLDSRLDDIRAVLQRLAPQGPSQRLQRLVGRLGWLWLLRGLAGEGLGWLERALGPVDSIDPTRVGPEALLWASGLRASVGVVDDAERWSKLGIAGTAEASTERLLAEVFAAIHLSNAHRFDEASAQLTALGGTTGVVGVFARLVAGQLARIFGRYDDAAAHASATLDGASDGRLAWIRLYALSILADAAFAVGDYPRAAGRAHEAVALGAFPPVPELTAAAHAQLALALLELGDLDEAGRQADEARRQAEALAPTSALGQARIAAGLLARVDGDLVTAAEELMAAVALHESGTPVLGIGRAYATLAHLHAERGESPAAFSAAGRGLALACDMSDPRAIPLQLEALAAAVAVDGRFEHAAGLLGSAAGYRASGGVPAVPHEQRDGRGLADRLSGALGADTLQQVWDVGYRRAAERTEETLAELRRSYATTG